MISENIINFINENSTPLTFLSYDNNDYFSVIVPIDMFNELLENNLLYTINLYQHNRSNQNIIKMFLKNTIYTFNSIDDFELFIERYQKLKILV